MGSALSVGVDAQHSTVAAPGADDRDNVEIVRRPRFER
jgi:hypothetical protein